MLHLINNILFKNQVVNEIKIFINSVNFGKTMCSTTEYVWEQLSWVLIVSENTNWTAYQANRVCNIYFVIIRKALFEK